MNSRLRPNPVIEAKYLNGWNRSGYSRNHIEVPSLAKRKLGVEKAPPARRPAGLEGTVYCWD